MTGPLRELLRLDLDAVDLRKGAMGLAAILVFGVFVAVVGNLGMVAALATLFLIVADQPGPPRSRGRGVLAMTLIGSLIALVGVSAGPDHALPSSVLTFVVVLPATLVAGLGPTLAVRGMLLSVWAVVAIGLAGGTETAVELAVAFAAGGLIATAIIWLRLRTQPEPSLEEMADEAARTIEQVLRSPLGWFALLRAFAVGVAMWVGAVLFPNHAIWAALTVVLVLRPRAGEAIAAGLLRTVGTLLGVIVAEAFIWASADGSVLVLAGFLLAAFGMTALQKVNYAVFVACLTAVLVLWAQLVTGAGEATAFDRLLATMLGAIIAFATIVLGRLILRWRTIEGDADLEARADVPDLDRVPG